MDMTVSSKDHALMQLAHYFITVQNYKPMVVRGAHNEIWLENMDAPYRIIRINANHIHNDEQFDFDVYKINGIIKQVKKKTITLSINTLNILLDVGDNANIKEANKIDTIKINPEEDLRSCEKLNSMFNDFNEKLITADDSIEFLVNVTNEINEKANEENARVERIFQKKNINVTMLLMAINIAMFIIILVGDILGHPEIGNYMYLSGNTVRNGEYYRIITSVFTHYSIIHLILNMSALMSIGAQVETYLGKKKLLIIYFLSGIAGNLLSCVVLDPRIRSIGASGAIFGLLGALLYFGYHYRLYLSGALKNQLLPTIGTYLLIGFLLPQYINNAAHIGGLFGGLTIAMAVGTDDKRNTLDTINGIICYVILVAVLTFLFFN